MQTERQTKSLRIIPSQLIAPATLSDGNSFVTIHQWQALQPATRQKRTSPRFFAPPVFHISTQSDGLIVLYCTLCQLAESWV